MSIPSALVPVLPITAEDIKRGYILEYPVPWDFIVRSMGLMPQHLVEKLNTIDELLPNECCVRVKPDGTVTLDDWSKGRRRDEIFSWLEEAKSEKVGIISKEEFNELWLAIFKLL
jgi:hypothetical protein